MNDSVSAAFQFDYFCYSTKICKMKKLALIIFVIACSASGLKAQWLWNINTLQNVKNNLKSPVYAEAYAQLLKDAEAALNRKPYSVTYKQRVAPSGDKHDYVSLSRYYWPDPSKPDGLPYINKDGQSNPELNKYDRNPLGNMAGAVNTLSLAYFYGGDERYAEKAIDFLRVWFLNDDTKMNPNLNYAQFIPGVNNSKGRSFGLIDTYSFVEMLNSIPLLADSKNYTPADDEGLKKWFAAFSEWWQTSEQGMQESRNKNNHSLAYDVQLVMYLLFSGDEAAARKVIDDFPQKRVFAQIEPDGRQPQELSRTLAFHYSEYNIRHIIDMYAIAKQLDVELYKVESDDGRSLYKAVDFLTPYLGKDVSEWPYKQISGWNETQQAFCGDLYRMAVIDPSRHDYLDLYKRYGKQSVAARDRLLYGAPE